jgi:hypothetical protein
LKGDLGILSQNMQNMKVVVSRECAAHLFGLCKQLMKKCEELNVYQKDYHVSNIVVNFDQITGWSVEWCDADLISNGLDLVANQNSMTVLRNFFNSFIFPHCFH